MREILSFVLRFFLMPNTECSNEISFARFACAPLTPPKNNMLLCTYLSGLGWLTYTRLLQLIKPHTVAGVGKIISAPTDRLE